MAALAGRDVVGFGFDESRRRLTIGETINHQKLGRPLLYPPSYEAKPLFHRRLFWGRSHARKLLQFCKKLAAFKKHEPARLSMSVTSGLNLRGRCRSQMRQW
jgi:hypothetical protein